MGANVQVCWEKFCNFWEVEARMVPMEGDRFHLDAASAAELCDENTIGVVAILGSTFDGSYEPVAEICAALDEVQQQKGWDIPVHVDGASGAMIAPFLDPELIWDFRLPRVASINTSGHKYGLVYPGVGWALWRDTDALPEELVFRVNYLGGDMPTFALNFSRPGAQVAAQYYTFMRLGRSGFRAVQQATRDVARSMAERIGALGDFRLLSRGDELPVFAFTTADDVTAFDVFDVSRRMRERGWLIPAYTFPPKREDLSVLRVVCRNGFSLDLADLFMADLEALLPELREQPRPLERPENVRDGVPPLGASPQGTPGGSGRGRPPRPRRPPPRPQHHGRTPPRRKTVSPATACGPGRSQRSSRRYLRTANGKNTASSTSGHTTASSPACPAAQLSPDHRGLANSSRTALAVADIGFHSATAPSQPGIDAAETKALERKPTGQTRICTACTSSGLPASRPR